MVDGYIRQCESRGLALCSVPEILGGEMYIYLRTGDQPVSHPIGDLIKRIDDLLPHVKLPFQTGTLCRFG